MYFYKKTFLMLSVSITVLFSFILYLYCIIKQEVLLLKEELQRVKELNALLLQQLEIKESILIAADVSKEAVTPNNLVLGSLCFIMSVVLSLYGKDILEKVDYSAVVTLIWEKSAQIFFGEDPLETVKILKYTDLATGAIMRFELYGESRALSLKICLKDSKTWIELDQLILYVETMLGNPDCEKWILLLSAISELLNKFSP